MKRASYREAVAFIAFNDDDGSLDARNLEVVRGYVSVGLIASIFGIEAERVARDVVRLREDEAAVLGPLREEAQ